MKRLFRWLADKISPQKAAPRRVPSRGTAHLRQTRSHVRSPAAKPKVAIPGRQPEVIDFKPESTAGGNERDSGDNVFIRKYVREDTGTHETLTILDEGAIETEEVSGIDPYNTGRFDRSKNWDKRFRKD